MLQDDSTERWKDFSFSQCLVTVSYLFTQNMDIWHLINCFKNSSIMFLQEHHIIKNHSQKSKSNKLSLPKISVSFLDISYFWQFYHPPHKHPQLKLKKLLNYSISFAFLANIQSPGFLRRLLAYLFFLCQFYFNYCSLKFLLLTTWSNEMVI